MASLPPPHTSGAASDLARLRRLSLGYAGGLALGALASWLRVAIDGTFHIDTGAPVFFVASALLGVGLSVAGLCAIRMVDAARGVPRDRLLRWALLANLPVVLAAPLTSSDVFHYLMTGRLVFIGKNPFSVPLDQAGSAPLLALAEARWCHDTTIYGPIMNLLLGAASWIGQLAGSPNGGSAAAFKLMMLACHLGFLVLAAHYLRVHRPAGDGARTLAIASFCPLIAWEITGQAHNDGLLVLALMLFILAAVEGRTLLAVLAVAGGTYAKVTLAPILALYLVFLLRTKGARAALYGVAALGLGVLSMLPFRRGFHGFGPMLEAIEHTARSHSLGDFFYNVLAPFGPRVQDQAVRSSLLLCLGVCAIAFVHALRARTVPSLLRGAFLFLLAWDLTIPSFQTWYVTWLFPFAVAEPDPRWQRLICVYGVWSAIEWAAPIDPYTTMAVNAYVIWQAAKLLRTGDAVLSSFPAPLGVERVPPP
jgi:hypothetical protein